MQVVTYLHRSFHEIATRPIKGKGQIRKRLPYSELSRPEHELIAIGIGENGRRPPISFLWLLGEADSTRREFLVGRFDVIRNEGNTSECADPALLSRRCEE